MLKQPTGETGGGVVVRCKAENDGLPDRPDSRINAVSAGWNGRYGGWWAEEGRR